MQDPLLSKNGIINYFITRVRITCYFSTGSSTRTKTVGFGDTTCCHYIKPVIGGSPCPDSFPIAIGMENHDDPGFNGMQ